MRTDTYKTFGRTALIGAAFIAGIAMPFIAAAQSQSTELETINGDKKNENFARPSARGPITMIRPAALWMAGLDSNHDYIVTQDEFETGLSATFAALDTNKDQRLSLFDIEDWRKNALGSQDASPHVLQFDNDYNSSISKAEFDATLIAIFVGSDKDDDKAVAFSELVTVMERPERERGDQAGQRGGERGNGQRGQRQPRR